MSSPSSIASASSEAPKPSPVKAFVHWDTINMRRWVTLPDGVSVTVYIEKLLTKFRITTGYLQALIRYLHETPVYTSFEENAPCSDLGYELYHYLMKHNIISCHLYNENERQLVAPSDPLFSGLQCSDCGKPMENIEQALEHHKSRKIANMCMNNCGVKINKKDHESKKDKQIKHNHSCCLMVCQSAILHRTVKVGDKERPLRIPRVERCGAVFKNYKELVDHVCLVPIKGTEFDQVVHTRLDIEFTPKA